MDFPTQQHCAFELVTLALVLDLNPPHILTSSLNALSLPKSWRPLSPQRILGTADRALVREVIYLAGQRAPPAVLEKVRSPQPDSARPWATQRRQDRHW